MKVINFIKKSCLIFTASIALFSCSKEQATSSELNQNVLNEMKLAQTIKNETYSINLYTETGMFFTGFNAIYIQIKANNGTVINDAEISWEPMMYMDMHKHSSPKSKVNKNKDNKSVYEGYIVFQMASNSSEYWELTINFVISGQKYSITEVIQVTQAPNRNLQVFNATNGFNYILAMVEPKQPKVALNNIKALLYRMDEHDFVLVDNYSIKIDPRMPGMANHSSPNNQDLYFASDSFYHGKLSLTMTGYWTVNLQVLNEKNEVIKGEAVTPTMPASSIYFDLEF